MKHDVLIIGTGIVGLATAYQLKKAHPDLKLLLCEKEGEVAKHQTGNNSGVLHSGLYYKPGSLKATNCINGYHKMIAFAEENNLPYDLCGKIVVATKRHELPVLENLFKRGAENGLKGFQMLEKEALKEHEPHVAGIKGFYVPQAGIIDYKKVSEKLAERLVEMGVEMVFNAKVKDIEIKGKEVLTHTSKGVFTSAWAVNCAGLYSDKIARLTEQKLNVKIIPFRGEYYKLKPEKEYLVKNLIYPVPDPSFPFLGVHFTRMMKGGIEAGPNAVLAFRREGYKKSDIHLGELLESLAWPGFIKVASKYWKTGMGEMYRSFSKSSFTKALQELVPEINKEDLAPGGAGVRAQACDRQGGLIDDFLILENERVINICNAPSPAATSSLSIGESIAKRITQKMSS